MKQSLYRLNPEELLRGRPLAQISHPVVSVLNFFRENKTVYMVMNYLQGDTCRISSSPHATSKRDKVFRESTIRSLFDEILRVLRIVHQHKMLHPDIKPANIFITDDNKAVMLDFGARARGAEQGRQLHPPDVHAGLRCARDVPRDGRDGALDRHLRHRRLHLCLHAGLPAE